jgi:hypothetical protein
LGEEEARGLEEKVGSGLGRRRDMRLGRRLGFHCALPLLYVTVNKKRTVKIRCKKDLMTEKLRSL